MAELILDADARIKQVLDEIIRVKLKCAVFIAFRDMIDFALLQESEAYALQPCPSSLRLV